MGKFALGMICGPWIVTFALALLLLTGAVGVGHGLLGPVILVYGSVAFSIVCTLAGALLLGGWALYNHLRK